MQKIVREKLEAKFPGDKIELNDFYLDGAHVEITITSEKFKGLSLVEQHQLVNSVLAEFLTDGSIHALKIKTIQK